MTPSVEGSEVGDDGAQGALEHLAVRRGDGHGQSPLDVGLGQLEPSPPGEALGIDRAFSTKRSPTLLGVLLLIGDRLAVESSCHGGTPVVAWEVYAHLPRRHHAQRAEERAWD